jgi:hypothetical protein
MLEAYNRFYYALHLTDAGLYDEAIGELGAMFEAPGGWGFRLVDAYPALDVLKERPGYIELRERFGDAR